MVGMTPWGVFFLACKLPYTKCWLLCQQAQFETRFKEKLSATPGMVNENPKECI